MNKLNIKGLEELTAKDIELIQGGGFFRTLGSAAHEALCAIQEFFEGDGSKRSMTDSYISGPYN